MGHSGWVASSAGSSPTGFVHPQAIEVMHEIGVNISANLSKHVDVFAHDHFDLVVTVCDGAKDACPTFPDATRVQHWSFEDPAASTGSDDERLAVFRRIRDKIEGTIRNYIQTQA